MLCVLFAIVVVFLAWVFVEVQSCVGGCTTGQLLRYHSLLTALLPALATMLGVVATTGGVESPTELIGSAWFVGIVTFVASVLSGIALCIGVPLGVPWQLGGASILIAIAVAIVEILDLRHRAKRM